MKEIFLLLLSIHLLSFSDQVNGADCFASTCPDSNITEQIRDECKLRHFEIEERCCFFNDTIVGLDLNDCNITDLNDAILNKTEIVVLGLKNNIKLNCSIEEYAGFVKLEFLALPNSCDCPGSWNITYDNHTCDGQIDRCQSEVNCTANGLCIPNGPGIAHCVCKPDHYGYRCLRQGDFPTVPFVVGTTVSTFVLSVFFWFTQRRFVTSSY